MKGKNHQHTLKKSFQILWIIWKNTPLLLLGRLLLTVCSTLLTPLSSVVLLRYVIDAVSSQQGTGRILFATGLFAVFAVGVGLCNQLFDNGYAPNMQEKFCHRLRTELYSKAAQVDLSCYDDPAYYDSLMLSVSSLEERFLTVLDVAAAAIGQLANLLCVATVLFSVDLSIGLVVFLTLLINLTLSRKIAQVSQRRTKELVPLNRKERYITDCFRLGEYAGEMRLGGIAAHLQKLYLENSAEAVAVHKKHGGILWRLGFLQETFGSLVLIHGVLLLYLIYRCVVLHTITIGDFAAVFNGVSMMLEALLMISGNHLAVLRENAQYYDAYESFLSVKPQIASSPTAGEAKIPQEIRFSHVSFSYDGKTEVLRDVSFCWRRGERLVLAGYNGSGKSTLIKLLMRFYDPTEGCITADGTDIRELSLEQWRRCFVTVFQDCQLYAAKLGENIAMDTQYDEQQVLQSLQQSGFLDSYRWNGDRKELVEREIGSEFGNGLRMSVGQRQQAALGRVYYYPDRFAVLDEPSAALDPMLEEQMNHRLLSDSLAKNRGVLVVSHRLSSAIRADRVLVLENGVLVEEGSHSALMERQGVYARLFEKQAKEYMELSQC